MGYFTGNDDKKGNYAQRATSDPTFSDPNSETKWVKGITGSEEKVTYYSDGSSTHHCGMCGDWDYDENGEEC